MNLEIANRLQKLRKERGLSQEELANQLGISRQAVSKWERAESSPDTDNLICLAKLYGVSLDELLNTDDTIEDLKPIEEDVKSGIKCDIDDTVVVFTITVAYFVLSIIFNIWHPLWIIFLFIPIISTLISAIKNKNPNDFAYPIFVTALYLFFGCVFGLWHPMWVIFLTIPLYYGVCNLIKKESD